MTADEFVSRLEKAKRTGRGTWIACCPAHEDRSPSMTIRETDGGTILLHCFAGCDVYAIASAVGVELHELFPPKPEADFVKPLRRSFPASDVLEAVSTEAFYVAFMASQMATGHELDQVDREVLLQSCERLMEARRLALG